MNPILSPSSSFLGLTSPLQELPHLEQGSFFSHDLEDEEVTILNEESNEILQHEVSAQSTTTTPPSALDQLPYMRSGSFTSITHDDEEDAIPQSIETPHRSPPPGFESPSEQDHLIQTIATRRWTESPQESLNSSERSITISPMTLPPLPYSPYYQLAFGGIPSQFVLNIEHPEWLFYPIGMNPNGSPLLPRPQPWMRYPIPMLSYPPYMHIPSPRVESEAYAPSSTDPLRPLNPEECQQDTDATIKQPIPE